jgi:hypothetical protein
VTGPPVAQLRAGPESIRLGAPGEDVWTLRVEIPEVWDLVRIDAPPSTPVAIIKQRALDELVPDAPASEQWVLKLYGFEVLDESVSLIDAGARNGSTFVVMGRHRRPVR